MKKIILFYLLLVFNVNLVFAYDLEDLKEALDALEAGSSYDELYKILDDLHENLEEADFYIEDICDLIRDYRENFYEPEYLGIMSRFGCEVIERESVTGNPYEPWLTYLPDSLRRLARDNPSSAGAIINICYGSNIL